MPPGVFTWVPLGTEDQRWTGTPSQALVGDALRGSLESFLSSP